MFAGFQNPFSESSRFHVFRICRFQNPNIFLYDTRRSLRRRCARGTRRRDASATNAPAAPAFPAVVAAAAPAAASETSRRRRHDPPS